MTTRRSRSDQYREAIAPYLAEWAERDFTDWQQFRNWSVQQVLWDYNLSMDDIEDITRIDGSRDRGIDGWFEDRQASPPRLILIQSKDTEITEQDFSKMRDGVTQLLNPSLPVTGNRALREKSRLFLNDLPETFAIDFYLTSSRIAQHALAPDQTGSPLSIEGLHLAGLGKTVQAAYFVRDIRFLYDNIQVMHENPIPATFHVEAGSCVEFTTGGNFKTVVAALRGSELAALYGRNKQNLFRKNPRYNLGVTGMRNKEMLATLRGNSRQDFFIYNNGLTCVARTARVEPSPGDSESLRISLEDFQIVNGCQTTATLYEASLQGNLDKITVLAKIVETPLAGGEESDAMSDIIAQSSNSQNPLKAEDWKSNDARQKNWHSQMRLLSPAWFYEIKRGTWLAVSKDSTDRRPFVIDGTQRFRKLTMKDLGQQCWAFLGHPGEAIEKARVIFDNADTYDFVFEETLTAVQLLLPHLVYLEAEAKRKQQKEFMLDESDPEYETYKDVRISTDLLRHPIVAAIGRVLAEMRGTSEATYVSRSQAETLIGNSTLWLPSLVERAFRELGRALLIEAVRSGVGARTRVRSNEWVREPIRNLAEKIRIQVDTQREMGGGQGTLADAFSCLFPESP